jgi:CubicO group peptidase (beta-lactamase class C family)
MKKQVLLMVLATCSVAMLSAQDVDFGKLNAYVVKSMKEHKVPGLAIGVVHKGEIVFQQGYGKEKLGEDNRVNTSSMFGIASLSKAFTTMAVGMLVDEGKLNWNDKVVTHLPDWRLYNDTVTQMMTIEDLLSHRCGLKTFDGDLLWYGTNYSREEIITRIRHLPPSYNFRDGFGYQNIMYITAGEVIEKVSGMTWDQFIDQRIFKPLGMNKTNTSITKYKDIQNVAYPHLKAIPQPLLNYDNSGATAAINSNVVDMQKWIQFLLANGIWEGDTLIDRSTLRKIWSVHNPLPVGSWDEKNGTHFKGYGLGWFLMDYDGVKVIHHGGGLPGYITKLALVPEEDLGIIVMTNDMSSVSTALMYKIVDLFTEKPEQRDWSGEFAGYAAKRDSLDKVKMAKQDQERKTDTQPSLEKDKFVGTYEDPYYGKATIKMEGKGRKGRLVVSLLPAEKLFTSNMEHWENDTWLIKFNDPFFAKGVCQL